MYWGRAGCKGGILVRVRHREWAGPRSNPLLLPHPAHFPFTRKLPSLMYWFSVRAETRGSEWCNIEAPPLLIIYKSNIRCFWCSKSPDFYTKKRRKIPPLRRGIKIERKTKIPVRSRQHPAQPLQLTAVYTVAMLFTDCVLLTIPSNAGKRDGNIAPPAVWTKGQHFLVFFWFRNSSAAYWPPPV
jgi:hypothetical protein